MHVFKEGKTRSRTTRRISFVQFLIGVLGVSIAGAMLRESMAEGDEAVRVSRMLFGVALFGAVFQSFRTWSTLFGKPGARIILTSRTLAVKIRKKPALLFKRCACHAYAPERRMFYFEDGSRFTPQMLAFVVDDWQEIPAFIFDNWWSSSELDAMKREVDVDFPITRWALILYFGEIFVGFVIAMVALIGGMTGWLEKTVVFGLIGVLVLVKVDWLRRHRWLLRRENKRGEVQFQLPAR